MAAEATQPGPDRASDPGGVSHAIGKALGRIPSGVFVLTAPAEPGARYPSATLVSWVQQAAFSPPAVCMAVAKGRYAGEAIKRSGVFALSVVAAADTSLMKKYARGVAPDADPFAGVETAATAGGLPVLAAAVACLECRLLRVCDFDADHDLFVAEVTDGRLLCEGPAFSHQRGNGMHY